MNRAKCIAEVVESLRQLKRAACGKLVKLPGIAITPSQWALLNLLYGSKHGINIKDVSKMMHVTGSAITQFANDLEEKGFLKRKQDQTDKRTIRLLLTTKCNKIMDSIQKSFTEECAVMFSKLSDSELNTLNHLHKKIIANNEN